MSTCTSKYFDASELLFCTLSQNQNVPQPTMSELASSQNKNPGKNDPQRQKPFASGSPGFLQSIHEATKVDLPLFHMENTNTHYTHHEYTPCVLRMKLNTHSFSRESLYVQNFNTYLLYIRIQEEEEEEEEEEVPHETKV